MHLTTVVTGFIDTGKLGESKRNKDAYFAHAEAFTLKLPLPLYCFIESENVDRVVNYRKSLGLESLTKVIPIDYDSLEMSKNGSSLVKGKHKRSNLWSNHAYVVAINSKVSFLESAIDENYFSSDYFLWMDFGIARHSYGDAEIARVVYIADNPASKVSLGLINNPEMEYDELMTGYHWVAIGGFFTLPGLSKQFLNRWKAEFHKAVSKDLYPYEEAIFYHLYQTTPEMFKTYKANYNTCIQNYPA